MFNTRAAVFYQSGFAPSGFRHDKTHAASFFGKASKTFLEKRVSREFITMMLL